MPPLTCICGTSAHRTNPLTKQVTCAGCGKPWRTVAQRCECGQRVMRKNRMGTYVCASCGTPVRLEIAQPYTPESDEDFRSRVAFAVLSASTLSQARANIERILFPKQLVLSAWMTLRGTVSSLPRPRRGLRRMVGRLPPARRCIPFLYIRRLTSENTEIPPPTPERILSFTPRGLFPPLRSTRPCVD